MKRSLISALAFSTMVSLGSVSKKAKAKYVIFFHAGAVEIGQGIKEAGAVTT